ncbi:MAG: YigZ family protein [Bacteroidales bacterium]
MNIEDTYKTIEGVSEGMFKDRGSKFISVAFPVTTEEEVKQRLDELRKKYHDARHHCYAYILDADKSVYRINDDGEPSGTAGRPIHGQLLSNDLTGVLIVVIRYFGGTKLGVSGLINAYRAAAKEAIESNKIITKTIHDVYGLNFKYEGMNDVMRIIKEEGLNIISQQFELQCSIEYSVRKKNADFAYERFSKIKDLRIKYLRTL